MTVSVERRRVVIAEDQQGMRGLVRRLLDDEEDLEVVAERTTGPEVLERVAEDDPDVLVLDLGLPDLDGEVVLERLRQSRPEVRIVVLSGQASAIVAQGLRQRGADAVIEKGVPSWESELLAAVRG